MTNLQSVVLKPRNKLLVFSAHPDDNIACAGTIMYLKSLGFLVYEVVFTGGENSINLNGASTKEVLVNTRRKEFEQASKIMGIDGFEFLGLPNDEIVRSFALINRLVQIIRREKPTVLISENPRDYHPDHRIIGTMIQEAIDRAGWGVSPELGEKYKTPVGLFKCGQNLTNVRMDIIVDTAEFVERKMEALKAYGSQAGGSMFQLTEGLDKYTGFFLRSKAAEAFELINDYPLNVNKLLGGAMT